MAYILIFQDGNQNPLLKREFLDEENDQADDFFSSLNFYIYLIQKTCF